MDPNNPEFVGDDDSSPAAVASPNNPEFIGTNVEAPHEQKLRKATDYYRQNAERFFGPGSQDYANERLPVVSAVEAIAQGVQTRRAQQAFDEGKPTDEHLQTLAQQQAKAEYLDSRKSFGQRTMDLATRLPGMAAEYIAAGPVAEGAEALSGISQATRAGRIGSALIGETARTAAMPSTYGAMGSQYANPQTSGVGAIAKGALESTIQNVMLRGAGTFAGKAAAEGVGAYAKGVVGSTARAVGAMQLSKEAIHDIIGSGDESEIRKLITGPNRMDALQALAPEVVVFGSLEAATHAMPLLHRTAEKLEDQGIPKGSPRMAEELGQKAQEIAQTTKPVAESNTPSADPTESAFKSLGIDLPRAPEAAPSPPSSEPGQMPQEAAGTHPEATQKTIDLSGMAKGMTDNLYGGLFQALKEGKDRFAGIKDPILAQAKPLFESGRIKSADDLRRFVNGEPGFQTPREKADMLTQNLQSATQKLLDAQRDEKAQHDYRSKGLRSTFDEAQAARKGWESRVKDLTKKVANARDEAFKWEAEQARLAQNAGPKNGAQEAARPGGDTGQTPQDAAPAPGPAEPASKAAEPVKPRNVMEKWRQKQEAAPEPIGRQFASQEGMSWDPSPQERAADEKALTVKHSDIPSELRSRSEALMQRMSEFNDPEKTRLTHTGAYALGGEEGLKALMEIQERRFAPPSAKSPKERDWHAEWQSALKELNDGVELAVRDLKKRGYNEAAIRRALAKRVREGAEAGRAAASQEAQGDQGGGSSAGGAPGAPENGVEGPWAGMGSKLTEGETIPPATLERIKKMVQAGDRRGVKEIKEMLARHYEPEDVKAAIASAGKFPKDVSPPKTSYEPKGHHAQIEAKYRKYYAEQQLLEEIANHEKAKAALEGAAGDAQEALHRGQTDGELEERAKEEQGANRESGENAEPTSPADTSFDFGANEQPGEREQRSGLIQQGLGDIVGDMIRDEAGSVNLDTLKERGKEAWEEVKVGMNHAKDFIDSMAQRSFPALTRAGRNLGDAAARLANVRTYVEHAVPYLTDRVLGPKSTPEMSARIGEALAELRLQYAKRNFAAQGYDEASKAVGTVIGKKGSAIKDQAEWLQVVNSPEFKQAVANYKEHVVPVMEDAYRRAQGISANDPIDSLTQIPGLPVSLRAVQEGEVAPMPMGGAAGNMRNVEARKLMASKAAKLSAEGYETDMAKIIENTIRSRMETAAKADLYRSLVSEGKAEWRTKGPRNIETEDGVQREQLPYVNPPEGTQEAQQGQTALYVDKPLINEVKNALGLREAGPLTRMSGKIMAIPTRVGLAAAVETTAHTLNQLTFALTKPGFRFGDIFKGTVDKINGDMTYRKKVVDLAEIGSMKPKGLESGNILPQAWKSFDPTYHAARFLDGLSEVMRVAAGDAFDRLAKNDKLSFDRSEGSKRDFVNQLGNYEKRAQNGLQVWLRESGFGPFATAGTNYMSQGIRSLGLDPGVKGADLMSKAALRARFLTNLTAMVGGVAALNYAMWGRVDGDEKTPFLGLKVGESNGKSMSIDLSKLFLVKRGLGATGLLALAEGIRGGQSKAQIADKMAVDVVHRMGGALMGPGPRDVYTALTGKEPFIGREMTGMDVADKAKPARGTVPAESQQLNNLIAGLKNANPAWSAWQGTNEPQKAQKEERSYGEKISGLLGPFGIQYRDRPPASAKIGSSARRKKSY
jgi:hypothetical protein